MNNEYGPIFYVNREDGFGARLNAMINAIALANHFNGKLAFSWEEKQRDGFLHSVRSKESVFSAEFNRKYYSKPATMQSGHAVVDLDKYLRRSRVAGKERESVGKVVVDVGSSLPELWLELVGEEANRDILKESFSKIEFNPVLATVIQSANALDIGQSSIALHLRAGDVVYANAKYKKSNGKKAVPFQLAWQYLKECRDEGKTVILFGQDVALCRALASQSNAVLCADILDRNWNSFQRELFEITLISRCSLAVGGESSFLRIAAAAAGKVPKSIYDIYSAAERQRIILGPDVPDIVDQAASPGQHLYSLWMVAADLFEDQSADIARLLSVTEMALSYIPDDDFMRICRACVLAGAGRFTDAETLIGKVATGEGSKSVLGRVRPSRAIEHRLIDFLDDAVAENRPWASALQVLLSAARTENSLAIATTALKDARVSASQWRRQILDVAEIHIRKSAENPAAANAQVRMFKRSLKVNRSEADKPSEHSALAREDRSAKAGKSSASRRNAIAKSARRGKRQGEHRRRGNRAAGGGFSGQISKAIPRGLSRMMTMLRRLFRNLGRGAR